MPLLITLTWFKHNTFLCKDRPLPHLCDLFRPAFTQRGEPMQMKQWKLVKYNSFVKFTLPSCEVLYISLPYIFGGKHYTSVTLQNPIIDLMSGYVHSRSTFTSCWQRVMNYNYNTVIGLVHETGLSALLLLVLLSLF